MNDQNTKKATISHTAKQQKLSDTSSSSPVIVPTPSIASEPDELTLRDTSKMESAQDSVESQVVEETQLLDGEETPVPTPPNENVQIKVVTSTKPRVGKKTKRSLKKSKRKVEESSASDSSDAESDSDSETSEEDAKTSRQRKQKISTKRAAAKKKQKAKTKSKKKSKKYDSTSDDTSSDSSSESNSESEVEDKKSRRKALKAKAAKKKSKKVDTPSDDSDSDITTSSSSSSSSEDEKPKSKRTKAKAKRKGKKSKTLDISSSEEDEPAADNAPVPPAAPLEPPVAGDDIDTQVVKVTNILRSLKLQQSAASASAVAITLEKPVKKNALEFKRVDHVFDMKIRDWKLVESNKDAKDEFDCVFTVRRRLNWEGKYQETQVDIKSKVLRNCLQEIFKECKSISLVEDTPQVDPHTLFHYYREIKSYVKTELKPKIRKARKSKAKKLITQQVAQCKLLLKFLDEDYTSVRKALKPMLKAGTITFDLVWALFKPNTIAFTPTYGNKDDPRCFRVESNYEYESWLTQAKSLVVDGKYLEYDGKSFGLGDHQVQIQAFKGHKKITSLAAYPLEYHKDPEVSSLF